MGLVTVFPAILIIGGIISAVAGLSKSIFSANMTMLMVGIFMAYVGGGIIPSAMLPSIVQKLSSIMPGKYLIANIAASLFGF